VEKGVDEIYKKQREAEGEKRQKWSLLIVINSVFVAHRSAPQGP